MALTSGDLELVLDGDNQTVGLRFAGVGIPRGATIVTAWVQFQVDETSSGTVSLTIAGEASDNTPTFTSATGNVSSRPQTAAVVPWSPPAWPTVGAAGAGQRTPNLAAVIQEIVNRAGWLSGRSLVLIVRGTGWRVAESYEGGAAAPR